MANVAWGIDLGNRALKAVKLVRSGDNVRIEDFEVFEHEQILSVAGDNRESLLQSALTSFMERHNVGTTPVAVSVSGQQSFARFIKLPPVEPKKIPEIVRFEAIQQIPFPLEDVEWAYQLFQNADSPDVEVGIFAMKKELVNRHLAYFTNLKLNVVAVQTLPLALYNAMHHDEQIGETVMFMDCGAENTDLIIADGQTVWLRSLPIGGNHFTETLAKSFKLSFEKAEELKRDAATSKYAKQIFQAMRPVFADLVAEIQRSIGFYSSVHREARIGRIIAQGATFQLPGLQKYLQQNLQLAVEKLDAFKAQPPADPKVAANLSEQVICLAGAYGLAIQALGQAKISSSLLPAIIQRSQKWQSKTPKFMTAAGLFLAGTAAVFGRWVLDNQVYDAKEPVRGQIRQTIAQAKELSGEWREKVENRGEEDRTRLLNIRSLQDYRAFWPTLLTDVLAAAPTLNMEALKKTAPEQRPARGTREQILLTSVMPNYWPDLAPVLADRVDLSRFAGSRSETAGSAAEPAAPAPAAEGEAAPAAEGAPVAKRGYVLTIRGITPHKEGGALVERTLIRKLLEKSAATQAAQRQNYYIAKAELVSAGKRFVALKPGDVAPGEVDADLGGSDATVRSAAAGAAQPAREGAEAPKDAFDPKIDRWIPDEKIDDDTEFVVVAVVVLDPPAPQKPKTDGGAE